MGRAYTNLGPRSPNARCVTKRVDVFKKALALEPDNLADTHVNIGVALLEEGRCRKVHWLPMRCCQRPRPTTRGVSMSWADVCPERRSQPEQSLRLEEKKAFRSTGAQ